MQSLLEKWRQDCSAEFPAWFGCTRQGAVRTALLRAENLRVLRRANQAENGVLRRAVSEQYRAVAEGLSRMAAAWQPEVHQPQLESRLHALANALQLPLRELQAVRRADGLPEVRLLLRPVRLGEGVTDTLEYSISRCCGVRMAMTVTDTAEGQELRFVPRARYVLHIGTAAKACCGVCGDVTEQLQCGPVRYLLLCDGMGTGANAAMDAKMTALFTARLLRAGFSCDVAARLVNAALLTRAPGDRGSTLDVLRFDGMDGSTVLYKAGACAAYLLRAGSLRRLGSADAAAQAAANGLPLGSAGTVKDTRLEFSLQPGDRVIMVSDGLLTGGEARLIQAIKALTPAAPQVMAQALLNAVAGSRPEDDCTAAVLCAAAAEAEPSQTQR
jgi:stage II sporulation protein E